MCRLGGSREGGIAIHLRSPGKDRLPSAFAAASHNACATCRGDPCPARRPSAYQLKLLKSSAKVSRRLFRSSSSWNAVSGKGLFRRVEELIEGPPGVLHEVQAILTHQLFHSFRLGQAEARDPQAVVVGWVEAFYRPAGCSLLDQEYAGRMSLPKCARRSECILGVVIGDNVDGIRGGRWMEGRTPRSHSGDGACRSSQKKCACSQYPAQVRPDCAVFRRDKSRGGERKKLRAETGKPGLGEARAKSGRSLGWRRIAGAPANGATSGLRSGR